MKKYITSVLDLLIVSKRTPKEGKYVVKILRFFKQSSNTAIELELRYSLTISDSVIQKVKSSVSSIGS